ncbi:transmembrane protein 60-like [Eurytemora carolleeae]|uniref:transmembrane protein 60-like n=1 Tax=Eurytemora carolleeae TaxID=1294199 RepID=UPI000C781E71|nr:transmembrane protein 60-like [Eurytemora carolleeae]|eukprot:XP_023340510.1 transmembrane protein 60-like [Eurytemora affinis]
MAVLHRALFTWFITLIFLILIVLRLDQRVRWSWFIVFVPMWLYDCILLVYLIFLMGSHRRTSNDRWQRGAARHIFCFVGLILKVTAEILLCLKLEGSILNLYYVMIPVWMGLPVLTLDVFLSLFQTDILEFCSNIRDR